MPENPRFTPEDHKAVEAAGFWYAMQDLRDLGERCDAARALPITRAHVAQISTGRESGR